MRIPGQTQRLDPGANRIGAPPATDSEVKKLFGDTSPIGQHGGNGDMLDEKKRKFESYRKKHLENTFHFYIPRSQEQ